MELLWEAAEPGRVLAERFGFTSAGMAAAWVAAVLAEHWDLPVVACRRLVLSGSNALAWVETGSASLVVKWSVEPSRFPRLRQLARLTGWLAEQRLPVSGLMPARDGSRQLELDGASLGVQYEIDGDLLDVGDPAQVRAAGAVLAELQLALAGYPDAGEFTGPAAAGSLVVRLRDWLEPRASRLAPEVVDNLRSVLDLAPAAAPAPQLTHGDFRAANLMCSGGSIRAVLDFEQAGFEPRIVELARSAVLLGTRFHDWGPVSPAVSAEFRAGYESVRPLTDAEAAWWRPLRRWHSWAMVSPGADPTGWAAAARELNREPGPASGG